MILRASKQASSGPPACTGFRKAEPLADGPRLLSEKEVAGVFSIFFPRKAERMSDEYLEACEALRSRFGAFVGVFETPFEGLRFRARLEFLTEHRALDSELDQRVAGEGFELKLCSAPVTSGSYEERFERRERPAGGGGTVEYFEPRTIRSYVITAGGRTSQPEKAAESAQALLKLAQALRPSGIWEDLPSNVIPLESARASHPHPTRLPQDSDSALLRGATSSPGGKAS